MCFSTSACVTPFGAVPSVETPPTSAPSIELVSMAMAAILLLTCTQGPKDSTTQSSLTPAAALVAPVSSPSTATVQLATPAPLTTITSPAPAIKTPEAGTWRAQRTTVVQPWALLSVDHRHEQQPPAGPSARSSPAPSLEEVTPGQSTPESQSSDSSETSYGSWTASEITRAHQIMDKFERKEFGDSGEFALHLRL